MAIGSRKQWPTGERRTRRPPTERLQPSLCGLEILTRRDTNMKNNSTAIKMKQSPEVLTDLSGDAVVEISSELRKLLADVFALYVKTKNFHWHMTGKHFRDYHLLLDEHSDQIFAMTDDIAERARKIGGTTLHSIGEIAKLQRLKDNNAESVAPHDMIAELAADNLQ